MARLYGITDAGTEWTDDWTLMVENVLRDVGGVAFERVETEIDRIAAGAEKNWPVGERKPGQTGKPHSRDAFTSGVRFSAVDTVEGFIRNTAEYAYFIKARKFGGQSPTVILMRKPVERAAQAIATELPEDVARLMESA